MNLNVVFRTISLALWMVMVTAYSAEIPKPGEYDAHIRYVTYKKDDVVVIQVQRGVVTRIMLDPEEQITVSLTGFAADCNDKTTQTEWCIHADPGMNQVWIKPKEGATTNNLELSTTKRDYSFAFKVLGDADLNGKGKSAQPMYRVIFRYPVPHQRLLSILLSGETRAPDEQEIIDERLNAKPIPRNWKYTMQMMGGSSDIKPSVVFDDGRFTYFKFPNNREIPSVFMVSETGEESRTNVHMEGDLAVVEKLGRQFVLRLGDAVIGIWNEKFDVDGVPAKTGVTTEGLKRVVK